MVFDLNTKVQELAHMSNNDTYYTNNTTSKCSSELKKSCIDCQTTRTPCWRSGPAGPKTLCNACGIRYRKRSRSVLKLDKGGSERNKKKTGRSGTSKLRRDHLSIQQQWKSKLGEEEQAAFLLMALSYGCVSA